MSNFLQQIPACCDSYTRLSYCEDNELPHTKITSFYFILSLGHIRSFNMRYKTVCEKMSVSDLSKKVCSLIKGMTNLRVIKESDKNRLSN